MDPLKKIFGPQSKFSKLTHPHQKKKKIACPSYGNNIVFFSWLKPTPGPVTKESAFQCSDDAFDLKIRGNSIICGLRNGTVEIWDTITLEREMTLTDQHGSVHVDANESVVAGVSSDSTVCIWDRKTGQLKGI